RRSPRGGGTYARAHKTPPFPIHKLAGLQRQPLAQPLSQAASPGQGTSRLPPPPSARATPSGAIDIATDTSTKPKQPMMSRHAPPKCLENISNSFNHEYKLSKSPNTQGQVMIPRKFTRLVGLCHSSASFRSLRLRVPGRFADSASQSECRRLDTVLVGQERSSPRENAGRAAQSHSDRHPTRFTRRDADG